MAENTLAQRILTAAVLIPLAIGAVLFLSTSYLALILAFVALLGGVEWARLAGISGVVGFSIFVLLLAGCFWLTQKMLSIPGVNLWFFSIAAVWWLLVAIALLRSPKLDAAAPGFSLTRTALGFLVIIPAWSAVVQLHGFGEAGPIYVLFLLVLIWVADSGAYFAGRRWGRTKLAPRISPGKTREGVFGALVGALICAVFFTWYQWDVAGIYWLVPISLVTVLMSVVGDLFESLIKRRAGIKDSGGILPGHGGVMDRIDSLTAAAPVFFVGLKLTGI